MGTMHLQAAPPLPRAVAVLLLPCAFQPLSTAIPCPHLIPVLVILLPQQRLAKRIVRSQCHGEAAATAADHRRQGHYKIGLQLEHLHMFSAAWRAWHVHWGKKAGALIALGEDGLQHRLATRWPQVPAWLVLLQRQQLRLRVLVPLGQPM